MLKVTATKCLNGKRHKWEHLMISHVGSYGSSISKWCSVCGCATEFYRDANMKRAERCLSSDTKEKNHGKYYVKIPNCLKE